MAAGRRTDGRFGEEVEAWDADRRHAARHGVDDAGGTGLHIRSGRRQRRDGRIEDDVAAT